ncbi:hypothetical protein [Actinomyces gerencseriae]|mgnify:FL=1|uniref:hypothetical protein n=1 Tax=Actinomyces gerencseriae TaxID=52769 RepID=UPI0028EB704C|nr:hypothetical protein [Actinomyces gerencseriae]
MSTAAPTVHSVAAPDLRIGPAGWDGRTLVAEAAAGENGSIYRLGPLETLVLDALRRPGTAEQVQDRVQDGSGVRVPLATVGGLIDAFTLRGLVESPLQETSPRPSADERGATWGIRDSVGIAPRPRADERAEDPARRRGDPASPRPRAGGRTAGARAGAPSPSPRSGPTDSMATKPSPAPSPSPGSGPLTGVSRAAWAVARTPVLPVLAVMGPLLAGLALVRAATRWTEVSAAAGGLTALPLPRILLVVLGVVVWHMVSQLGHELSHGMAFVRLGGGRRPTLSLTSLGPIPVPSTRLDGLGLVPARWRGLVVVAAGPLFTLALAAIPATVAVRAPAGDAVAAWGAISLLIDLTIVILSLAPFPNTDMTRGLEILTATRQLPIASARFRRGGRVPDSLPTATRLAVRTYPLLLVPALSAVLAWATCLLMSLI